MDDKLSPATHPGIMRRDEWSTAFSLARVGMRLPCGLGLIGPVVVGGSEGFE